MKVCGEDSSIDGNGGRNIDVLKKCARRGNHRIESLRTMAPTTARREPSLNAGPISSVGYLSRLQPRKQIA